MTIMYCVIFLLVSLTFHGRDTANNTMFSKKIASKQYLCSFRYSFHIPKYSGKYLFRRISHASNGSYNPFIITNKEAHTIHGNPFTGMTYVALSRVRNLSDLVVEPSDIRKVTGSQKVT